MKFFASFLTTKINNINIIGNQRISDETIILFSELKEKQKIDEKILNDALKKLYETGYFELINITTENSNVTINVKEYKIIQSSEVTGIKNKTLIKKIKENRDKIKVIYANKKELEAHKNYFQNWSNLDD